MTVLEPIDHQVDWFLIHDALRIRQPLDDPSDAHRRGGRRQNDLVGYSENETRCTEPTFASRMEPGLFNHR